MNLNIEKMRSFYRLNNIVRYNTWGKINPETVASHSYFTTLFTMMICDELGVDSETKLVALQLSVIHDLSESITNDITYDAKCKMPKINAILKEYEDQYVSDHFPELVGVNAEDGLANLIVKIADVLSVVQYCDNEVNLGNKKFTKLLVEAMDRLKVENQKLGKFHNKNLSPVLRKLNNEIFTQIFNENL